MRAVTIDKFQIHDPVNFVDPSGMYSERFEEQFINANHYRQVVNDFHDRVIAMGKGVLAGIDLIAGGTATATVGPLYFTTFKC